MPTLLLLFGFRKVEGSRLVLECIAPETQVLIYLISHCLQEVQQQVAVAWCLFRRLSP